MGMAYLGLDSVDVGLFEDISQQLARPGAGGHRDLAQQVAGVVGATAVLRGAWQHCADRVNQAAVGVGDDQLDTKEAEGDQRAHEGEPAGVIFLRADAQAEDLAAAICVHATAIRAWTLKLRPPSRNFWENASTQTNLYGPHPAADFRKW
jgi:hypothetical protein